MPSYRSRICRMVTKYLVAARLKPGTTIGDMRRATERLAKLAWLPAGTDVEKIRLNGMSARWLCSNKSRPDQAILYLHGK